MLKLKHETGFVCPASHCGKLSFTISATRALCSVFFICIWSCSSLNKVIDSKINWESGLVRRVKGECFENCKSKSCSCSPITSTMWIELIIYSWLYKKCGVASFFTLRDKDNFELVKAFFIITANWLVTSTKINILVLNHCCFLCLFVFYNRNVPVRWDVRQHDIVQSDETWVKANILQSYPALIDGHVQSPKGMSTSIEPCQSFPSQILSPSESKPDM